MYEFSVTDEELAEIEQFIRWKVALYLEYKETPDDEIPECSPDERWAESDKWAVMKEKRKSAVRVLDNQENAEKMAEELTAADKHGAKHYVEYRKGYSKKCAGYCSCKEFCSFYKTINIETSNEEISEKREVAV